jgi:signal transduction histidine kinase
VNKISRGGFVTYGKPDGLASRSVQSVFDDQEGKLCAVAERNSVSCFDGRRFHSVSPSVPSYVKYWGWGAGQLTFQDHTGKWWVPTGQGLFRFPKTATFAQLGRVRPEAVYDARNGLPGDIFRLFEDSRGDVWIATQAAGGNGLLMRWERATGMLRNVATSLLAYAFAEDRAGNVWIGFNGALARYCRSRLQFFEAPKVIHHYEVRALHLDREGRLWVACRNGVVRVDSADETPQFTTYTTANGLSSNEAQCVTEDLWGRIYVGTGRGVDCFSPRMPLYIRHYTKADGIAVGNGMRAFRDHKGALWFGTPLGLSRLEPQPERPRTPPPILISALRVQGVPRRISPLGETAISGLKLGPNQNQIELEFVGLGFGTGEALRYQYRLEGADTAWSQPTDERRIDYASLSPGSYRFLVRAVASDGLMSATPATVEFAIAAPVWQRWWMRMLLMIVSGAILYSLYRYRVSRLLEMERLRTRIATDLHDDVGSTLSQIAILSEVASRGARTEEQLEWLSEIADLSRESVDSMSDIVWAIDPEQDRLGDLSRRMRRFASDLLASSGIQIEFHAPGEEQDPEIGADMRRQIFLVFKETLHNTARHSGCTAVEIDFKLANGWLALTVRDNGKGFDMAQRGDGHGLASIEKRAKQLRGQVTVNSVPGRGTIISLLAPLG